MAFSVVVGVAFGLILLAAIRALRLPLLATRIGYTGAAVIGAVILYGLTFGLIAFARLRPSITAPSLRQAAA